MSVAMPSADCRRIILVISREDIMNIGTAYKPKVPSNQPVGLLVALSLPKQSVDAHRQILAGFPFDIVSRLSTETHLDEKTICQWMGINRAIFRRKNKEDKIILSVAQSGKLYLFVMVLDTAMQLFNGDMAATIQWLKTPARALDGECPLHMLTTPIGVEAVIDLIGRIEHGVVP